MTNDDKDFVAAAGGAALGARLRRLSAAIDADATRIYAEQGVAFEQRWFGILNQLALRGPMSVSMIAQALGISHPSVSETRRSLEKEGLIVAEADPRDARRRLLMLSPAGQGLARRLRPLWDKFDEAARELDAEAGNVTQALARLEAALARKSLHERIGERLGKQD